MWMCIPEINPLVPELRQRVYRACGIGPDGKLLFGRIQQVARSRKRKTGPTYSVLGLSWYLPLALVIQIVDQRKIPTPIPLRKDLSVPNSGSSF